MTVARSVSEVLGEHVAMELEWIDRLYLNLYVPILQRPEGVAHFWIRHRGHRFASSALMAPMTSAFVRSIERFARSEGLDLLTFERGQRKEEVARDYLDRFEGEEGVLFIGKAQEKAPVVRTERRRNPRTGEIYPWLVKSTAMVNQYYFYCVAARAAVGASALAPARPRRGRPVRGRRMHAGVHQPCRIRQLLLPRLWRVVAAAGLGRSQSSSRNSRAPSLPRSDQGGARTLYQRGGDHGPDRR